MLISYIRRAGLRSLLWRNVPTCTLKAIQTESKLWRKSLLAQNAEHKDWCCTEELMNTTKDGKALYLHCLPADINDVSCKDGEVEASVFDRYRTSALQRSKLQTIHHRCYDLA